MTGNKRQKAYARGVEAENIAAGFMKRAGYKLLETRYKTPVGEVDLIFVKADCLVFAEVKSYEDQEQALYAIGVRSRRRIEAAATYYISMHKEYVVYGMRFDVLIVPPSMVDEDMGLAKKLLGTFSRERIHHLDNAWIAGQ